MAIAHYGDVRPAAPTNFPSDPGEGPRADTNSDGLEDWLYTGADEPTISGVAGTQPDASTGGVVWNSENIWYSFDQPADVEVGKYEWGYLSVSQEPLRREQLVIGEYGDGTVAFSSQANFNNDPRIFVGANQVAINLAKGEDLHEAEIREGLDGTYAGTAGGDILATGSETVSTRAVNQDNDIRVGVNGTARLYIQTGAWVEVLRKMTIAENDTSTGYVEVNNSHLIIDGRTEESATDAARTTLIGGDGVAELVIENDGTVSIGFMATIGSRSKVTMRGGRLTVATIDLTDDPIAPAASTLTNNGIIVVEEGTNVINATVVNNGEIYVAPGATLIFKGTCSGNAPKRSVCGAPAIVIGWTAGAGGSNPLPAGKVEAVV